MKKNTKKSLLFSVLALILCCALLAGTTLAWFTDTASTAVNKIQAGTLDVALEMKDDSDNWVTAEGKTLQFKKAGGAPADEQVLWEPGCTYQLPELRIVNNGNLKLKYRIDISGIVGDAKLLEAIDFTYTCGGQTFDVNKEHKLEPNGANSGSIVIEGKMRTDAGNEYQGLSIDGIGITVYAAQATGEYDSFNNTYDTNATYLNYDAEGTFLISNADELIFFAKAVNSGWEVSTAANTASVLSEGVNAVAAAENTPVVPTGKYATQMFKLTADIDLDGKKWVPIGKLVNYPGVTFSGTFDGQSHTISNMNAVDNTVKNAVAGFFGSTSGATIQNVTFKDAVVKSTHYAGVVVAYEGANSSLTNVKNVVVDGAAITSSAEYIDGSWDNGDKVGGIVGYATSIAVDDCTVKNSTITGYRDLGGIGGCLDGTYHSAVTNCTVDNVTITVDNTHNYKNYTSNSQHNVSDFIGRNLNNVTATGNTGKATYVRGETAGTAEELSAILASYTTNSGENIAIELTKDFDMANSWTTYNIGNYNGVNSLTINGNNHKITNLNAPLLMGAFAGSGVITINDLTISDANISQNAANLGLGAFIMHSDASGGVVFKNCKLENSVITCTGANLANGSAYAGGFIGYSSSTNTTFTGCSVTNCQISGQKSAGALIGHAQTNLTVDGCTVTGNTISETLAGRTSPGAAAIVGRVSSTPITVKNTIVSDNTIKQGAAVSESAENVVCANAVYTDDGNNTIG